MTTRAWNANAAKYRHMVYLTKELNTQWEMYALKYPDESFTGVVRELLKRQFETDGIKA